MWASLVLVGAALAAANASGLKADGSAFRFAASLGSHMVLQRAPLRASIWGFADPGTGVKVSSSALPGSVYPTTADAAGVWQVALDAVQPGGPYTVTAASDAGASLQLDDVLFGDVYVCGGQSNMQMTVDLVFNASEEMQQADQYPNIRLFTATLGARRLQRAASLGAPRRH